MSCIPSGFACGTKVSSRVGTNLNDNDEVRSRKSRVGFNGFFFQRKSAKELLLMATLRIPKHQAPNYQFTVSSLRKLEFLKKYPPGQIFFDRGSVQRIFFKTVAMHIFLQTIFFGREKGGSKELNHNTLDWFLGGLEKSIKNVFRRW